MDTTVNRLRGGRWVNSLFYIMGLHRSGHSILMGQANWKVPLYSYLFQEKLIILSYDGHRTTITLVLLNILGKQHCLHTLFFAFGFDFFVFMRDLCATRKIMSA